MMASDGSPASSPVIQYWDMAKPPGYVAELIETFRKLNPDRRHRLFDEGRAERFIATNVGAREASAFRSCAVPAMQADYFRYCAVLVLGGVYVDVGFRCVSSLDSLIAGCPGGLLFRRDPPGYLLNGCFFFAAPGHLLLRLTLDVATANIEARAVEMVQLVTGPWIFSALWLLYRLVSDDTELRFEPGDYPSRVVERLGEAAAAVFPTRGAFEVAKGMIRPLLEVVGSSARLERAFEGVRVAPTEEMRRWICEAEDELPYRRTDLYWINWQKRGRSIFVDRP